MPITASRNAPARNSGTRKIRILADAVSTSASAAPPIASFAESARAQRAACRADRVRARCPRGRRSRARCSSRRRASGLPPIRAARDDVPSTRGSSPRGSSSVRGAWPDCRPARGRFPPATPSRRPRPRRRGSGRSRIPGWRSSRRCSRASRLREKGRGKKHHQQCRLGEKADQHLAARAERAECGADVHRGQRDEGPCQRKQSDQRDGVGGRSEQQVRRQAGHDAACQDHRAEDDVGRDAEQRAARSRRRPTPSRTACATCGTAAAAVARSCSAATPGTG